MKFFCLYFSCLLFLCFRAEGSTIPKDSTDIEDEKVTSLVISTDYSTNTNTFGRFDNVVTQPSFSPGVNYFSKWGFNVGAIGYFVANSDSTGSKTTSELDLQASYVWNISSVINISSSYSHFFYSNNSSTLKRSYDDYVQISINGNKKWWNGSISSKYLWGVFDELMLTGQTSLTIKIDHVLGRKNSLELQPTVEVNMSNINYFRYISGNYKFLSNYASMYPDATFNDLIADLKTSTRPLIRRLNRRIAANPNLQKRLNKISTDGNLVISDLFSAKKEMKFSSLGLTLPLYYYIGDFILNASFSAYKPYNQPKIIGNDWIMYFGAGISYTIDW